MTSYWQPVVAGPRGRDVASAQLGDRFLAGAPAARDWSAPLGPLMPLPPRPELPELDLPPEPEREDPPHLEVRELIERLGTRRFAELTRISYRQAQRYKAGTANPRRARLSTRERLMRVRDEVAEEIVAERYSEAMSHWEAECGEAEHEWAAVRSAMVREWQAAVDEVRDVRRATGQSTWGPVAEAFGGTAGLAAAAGVSVRQAERYLAGAAQPSAETLDRLRQADRLRRMPKPAGLSIGVPEDEQDEDQEERDRTGTGSSGPAMPIYVRAQATIHVGHADGTYDYESRAIGTSGTGPQGMHELPPEVAEAMFEAIAAGDTAAALDALQEHLSLDYADVGDYAPEDGIGFLIEQIQGFELYQYQFGAEGGGLTRLL